MISSFFLSSFAIAVDLPTFALKGHGFSRAENHLPEAPGFSP